VKVLSSTSSYYCTAAARQQGGYSIYSQRISGVRVGDF